MRGPLHERLGEDFFRQVPSTPGVYLMLDDDGGLLYVGKAKNLRTRLRSYSRITAADEDRLVLLVSAVRAIKWEECRDDELAVARETELLRAMRPPFNVTHAAASEYLSIAVARRSDRLRLRLTGDEAQQDETRYGCFAFAAATPDSYKALTRLLFLAQAGAPSRVPSGLARAAGYEFDLAPPVQRSVRDYLGGRSSRLLAQLQELIGANHSGEILVQRAAARDLEALEAFFALGPHALRRLQRRHGEGFGPVTAAELTTLLAREMGDQTGVKVQHDPASVTQRIVELREEGLGFRALARRLNAEGVPRLRGSGRWRAVDVAELLQPNLRQ